MQISKTLTGAALAQLGFVHVTGLPTYQKLPGDEDYRTSCIQARNEWLGRYDTNNGMMVVVTTDGEVWLADASVQNWKLDDFDYQKLPRTNDEFAKEVVGVGLPEPTRFEQVINTLCPNGKGAGVPCSNGEFIPGNFILMRLADPTSDCRGFFSAEPKLS